MSTTNSLFPAAIVALGVRCRMARIAWWSSSVYHCEVDRRSSGIRRLIRVGGSGLILTVLATAGFFLLVESSLDSLTRLTLFAFLTVLFLGFSYYLLRTQFARLRRELLQKQREFEKRRNNEMKSASARLKALEKELRTQVPSDAHSISSAIAWLSSTIQPSVPIPFSKGWVASPEFLSELYRHIRTMKPRFVLDLGSGLSTLIAGYAVKANGVGKVMSWDHLEEFAEETRARVSLHGLSDVVDIHHKPLVPVEISGEEFLWFDEKPVLGAPIDLLVVDGPPANTGKNARYPAIPLLKNQMSSSATIFFDDVGREDERESLERWMTQLENISSETILGRDSRQFAVIYLGAGD
jgi:predicted O-methyltransferase YrrM